MHSKLGDFLSLLLPFTLVLSDFNDFRDFYDFFGFVRGFPHSGFWGRATYDSRCRTCEILVVGRLKISVEGSPPESLLLL